MGSLYKLTSPNGKSYIGITLLPIEKRWKYHLSRALNRNGRWAISAAIRKYGHQSFKIDVLQESDDWNLLCNLEKQAIIQHNTLSPNGYNLTGGGEGIVGYKLTSEDIASISAAQKRRYSDPVQLEKLREQGRHALDDPIKRALAQSKAAQAQRSDEYRKRASESAKNRVTAESRSAAAERFKAMWREPHKRAALLEKLRGIKQSPEFRLKASIQAKQLWNIPGKREQILKGIEARSTDEWKDKIRKSHLGKKHGPASLSRKEKIRDAQKASWANPVTRLKRLDGMAKARAAKHDLAGQCGAPDTMW